MTQQADVIALDLTGLMCPDPLLRVTEALKQVRQGQRIEATVDFSPAVLTITSIVTRQPWDIAVQGTSPGVWKLTLTPRPQSAL